MVEANVFFEVSQVNSPISYCLTQYAGKIDFYAKVQITVDKTAYG